MAVLAQASGKRIAGYAVACKLSLLFGNGGLFRNDWKGLLLLLYALMRLACTPVILADIPVLATLHAACFRRHWDEQAMAGLLRAGATGILGRTEDDTPVAFLLWQRALDSADILTCCVLPVLRQKGLGGQLLGVALVAMQNDGIREVFLETSVNNVAAQSLYRQAGFQVVGGRKGYYVEEGVDALLMRRETWIGT